MLRLLTVSLFLLIAGVAAAQPQPAPPAGLTQQQFDALVDAIAKAVAQKLKAEGTAPQPTASGNPPSAPATSAITLPEGPDEFAVVLEKAGGVVKTVPAVGERLGYIAGLLDRRAEGGHGASQFLLLLTAIAVVAVAAEAILRRLWGGLRSRLAADAGPENGLRSLMHLGGLVLLDGLGVLVVWLIGRAAIGAWFTRSADQHKLAMAIMFGIVTWRLYVLLFRVVLRPTLPRARLCEVEDHEARAMFLRVSVAMLLLILGRMLGLLLVAVDTPAAVVGAYQAMTVPAYVALFLWLAVASRRAARQWLLGLAPTTPLMGVVGRHWVGIAVAFFLSVGGTQLYGVLSGRLHVGGAMLITLNVVVALVMFETLLQALVRRLDSQLAGFTPASDTPKLPDVVARCVRVAVLISALLVVARNWAVEVLGLFDESAWSKLTQSSRIAGITLFVAYVLWELFKYATDPYVRVGQGPADGASGAALASRMHTMMRLVRTAVAIVITLVAVMIALEDFGVNITPLIAGASVFGIAISFGSQALVKDIVSGIFYLYDDAFRVGEYIDCGKAKGTVEGFTLRSIRLRHQSGLVHTIPFGELGQIANYSRDWSAMKFNLRFARDTDLEKLRKAAKKIGAEMMEDPALKADIIEPFKMQGIAEVADNALVVRFKFTARPGNPGRIQNEAVTRMLSSFPGLGIEFAR